MNDIAWHPLLNACLNGSSALFILLGFLAILRGDRQTHKKRMLTALALSSVFLVSYLIRYYTSGDTPYQGQGLWRVVYFSILISHIILAALVPFVVVSAVYLAIKNRLASHRRVVRFALPMWAYVSVTGVVIYAMLYHFPGQS